MLAFRRKLCVHFTPGHIVINGMTFFMKKCCHFTLNAICGELGWKYGEMEENWKKKQENRIKTGGMLAFHRKVFPFFPECHMWWISMKIGWKRMEI